MFLVGLTGGIASGKSTVSAMLGKFETEIIDADVVAREVVSPGSPGLVQVVKEFGSQILDEAGALNRPELASLVFSDPARRRVLESILHPLIKSRTLELISASQNEVVVYVVPLLVEASVEYPFDFVVTVEAGIDEQIRRLVESRNMTREEALARIEAQATEAQRLQAANLRIDGSQSLAELEKAVSQLWIEIQSRAAEKAKHGKN